MNFVIVYATHTGSTLYAAKEILGVLATDHRVTMKTAVEATKEDLEGADAILIGSSSWDWGGNRGYPLKDMADFLQRVEGFDFSGKKMAIFGCGDMDFEHFCGAVDVIAEALSKQGAMFLVEHLRLNRYFIDEFANQERARDWAREVAMAINKDEKKD